MTSTFLTIILATIIYLNFYRLLFILSPFQHSLHPLHTITPLQPDSPSVTKLISPHFASQLAHRVKNLSHKFQRVNHVLSVLGQAAYIHGPKKTYLHPHMNDLLWTHFSDLYQILLNYFKSRVPHDYSVQYRFALPGFHVFHCNTLFSLPVASVHTDKQYRFLPFDCHEKKHLDFQNTLSFTLTLELPESGGGLYVLENFIPTKINYLPGYIVCHNGNHIHMITPSAPSRHRSRITLQGHGILDTHKKIYWLYW